MIARLALVYLINSLVCVGANAAEMVLEYEVEVGYESDSNVRLSNNNETEIQGGVVSPSLTYSRKTRQLDLSLDLDADFAQFDESNYDSDDQALAVQLDYRRRQQRMGASASLVRNSTRTSELEDTGRYQDGASRREEAQLDIYWEYIFSKKNAVALRVEGRDVSYETPFLANYDFADATMTYTHTFSERLDILVQAYAQRYDPDLDYRSENYGGQLGLAAALSKNLTLAILAGTSVTEETIDGPGVSVTEDSNGWVADGSLVYEQRKSEWSLAFVRAITPSGNGFVQETNIGRVRWIYRLGEYVSFVANATVGQNEALGLQREFLIAQAGLRYRMGEAWRLSATYRYRTQKQFLDNDTAHANALLFTLSFSPRANKWRS